MGPRACSSNTQASGSVPHPAPTPDSITYQPSSFVPHRVPCSRHFQEPSLGLLQHLLGLRQSPEHQKGPHSLLELLTVGRVRGAGFSHLRDSSASPRLLCPWEQESWLPRSLDGDKLWLFLCGVPHQAAHRMGHLPFLLIVCLWAIH